MILRFQSISVVIPTKNRPDDLEATVASLLKQTTLPEQLIIVDQSLDGESQRRVEACLRGAPVEAQGRIKVDYIRDTKIVGSAVARNRAMELAQGEIWVFLDDDVILELDFIEQLLAAFVAHPDAVGVSGVVTNYVPPPTGMRLWTTIFMRGPFLDLRQPIYWHADRLRDSPPLRVPYFGAGLMAFRASAIRGIRFDHTVHGVPGGEDVDFYARLGPQALLLMTPKARLVHNQSPHNRERVHWLTRHVRGWTYLYRRNWQHGLTNYFSYLWLNFGYAALASFLCFRGVTLQPWRSFLTGRREGARAARPSYLAPTSLANRAPLPPS